MRQVKEYVPAVMLFHSRKLVQPILAGILSFACGASSTAPDPTGPAQTTGGAGTTAPAQTTAASEQPPIVESLPRASAPAQPSGLGVNCLPTPDTAQQSPTCPVLRWLGLTYWAYSHNDNRLGMTIVAYDSAGIIVKQWERMGARYVWRIVVDATARTVTFWGQASNTILMTWDELKQR